MTFTHETYAEYFGDDCSITGTAVYDVTAERFFDRDIGGSDGLEVTNCELLHVKLDGQKLSRDFIEAIIGKAQLLADESAAVSAAQSSLDAGDYEAAA